MTIQVIDTPQPALAASKAKALYAEGVRYAILYVSPINLSGSKTVRRPHIDALRAAGIGVGFVCEGWGGSDNFAHNDINAATGKRDGQTCSNYFDQLGVPAGTAVYPTVDNDTSPSQIKNLCVPYFQAFRAALDSKYRLGAYGCGALLFALEQTETQGVNISLIDYPWLSNAMEWSRSREYAETGRAAITQGPELKGGLLGIDIDPNVLNPKMTDFGFWRADGAGDIGPTHDTKWVQHSLNVLKVEGTPLIEDGIAGPRTHAAVAAFQRTHNLTADGIAGVPTVAAIEKALTALPQSNPGGDPVTSMEVTGKMSTFGGPRDTGVSSSEGLAIVGLGDVDKFPGIFLSEQPPGTTGLARRLDPNAHYLAMRWDYAKTPRTFLQGISVKVSANGKTLDARPVDWGPNERTGRIADLSPGLASALGLETDDVCHVVVPLPPVVA